MKAGIIFSGVATLLFVVPTVCQNTQCGQEPMITTHYVIEYPDPRCSNNTAPDNMTVVAQCNSRALTVLESAANVAREYRISVTYFGNFLGYFVDAINGTASSHPCYWFIYFLRPNGELVFSPVGLSNLHLPEDGYTIIMRYETYDEMLENSTTLNDAEISAQEAFAACQEDPSVPVTFEIQYPDSTCTGGISTVPPRPVTLNTTAGGVAQEVLERAVELGRSYRFTATYFGSELGYFVDAINGTRSNNPCFWFFLIQEPGSTGDLITAPLGISNYVIPGEGYSIVFQYKSFVVTEPDHMLEISFINDSPRVVGNSVQAEFTLNGAAQSVTCQLLKIRNERVNCSSGSVTYSNLQPGRYILRVVASNSREDKVVERREIEINADSDFCTIHLINDGVKVNGDSVEVYFAGMGSTDSYYCWMKNNRMGFNCRSPVKLNGLAPGDYQLKIVPMGCGDKRRQQTVKFSIPQ